MTGFLISLVVHLEALRGVDISSSIPFVGLLHVGAFVVFVPFVLFSRGDTGGAKSLLGLAKGLPLWVAVLGGAILVYVAVNFALSWLHLGGESRCRAWKICSPGSR